MRRGKNWDELMGHPIIRRSRARIGPAIPAGIVRTSLVLRLLLLQILLLGLVGLAPYIGLGRSEDFFLYQLIGVSRGSALRFLLSFLALFCLVQLFTFNRAPTG